MAYTKEQQAGRPKPLPARERKLAQARERRKTYGGASNWNALKEQVFARDRYRCVLCGADNAKTGVQLEAAHLRAVGMGGRKGR